LGPPKNMSTPQHVVVVPDGNRRWAKGRGRPPFFGHIEGAKRTEEIIRAVFSEDITHFTFWSSSVANLTARPPEEVGTLFSLYEEYFTKLAREDEIHKNKTRIRVIGRWRDLTPQNVQRAIGLAIEKTQEYTERHLTFLVGYDGREEMLNAIGEIARNSVHDVTRETIKSHLWTRELPAVDLVIRTGGEPHWSAGLMMWDVADAQLHFTETLWPDFYGGEFSNIISSFKSKERRFGA